MICLHFFDRPGSVPVDLVNINFSRPDGPEFQIVASFASMLEEPELVDSNGSRVDRVQRFNRFNC